MLVSYIAGLHPAGTGNGTGLSGLTRPFSRSAEKNDPAGRLTYPASFASSPVNGLLYVQGKIGKSRQPFLAPGLFLLHLKDCKAHLSMLYAVKKN